MAPPGDRAFPVQDALTSLLKGLTELAAWHVDYGIPLSRGDHECWVDEQVTTQRVEVTSGGACFDETFTVHIWLYAKMTAASALEIREVLHAVQTAIEAALVADITLGGIVMSAYVSGTEFDSGIADAESRSRDAAMTIDVVCTAFVSAGAMPF